jgi:CheY-like chemotaxis protein
MNVHNNILLVEDDEFKALDITSLINSVLPNFEIFTVGDVGSGIATIQEQSFKLIVLDIALPSRKLARVGGTTSSLLSGGVEIIYRIEESNRRDPIVIITQYPDIEIEGEHISVEKISNNPGYFFDAEILGCFRYQRDNQPSWGSPMTKILMEMK